MDSAGNTNAKHNNIPNRAAVLSFMVMVVVLVVLLRETEGEVVGEREEIVR